MAEQGYAKIRALIDAEGQSLEIHQWLFDTMSRWESDSHALRLGGRFVARLVDAGFEHEALELYLHCRRRAPAFAPTAKAARLLAGYARSIGRHGAADELAAHAAADQQAG